MIRPSLFGLLSWFVMTSSSSSWKGHAAIAPPSAGSSSSSQRLAQVIAGMAAEGCEELTTACVLGSRSMTTTERAAVSQQLVGGDDGRDDDDDVVARGSAERALAVAQPGTGTADIAAATVAADGNVVYCPSRVDLERGEGLFTSLAAAMEVIVRRDLRDHASLLVVADDPVAARPVLRSAVERVLSAFRGHGDTAIHALEDVFATVRYVTPDEAVRILTSQERRGSASEAASRVAIASKSSSSSSSSHKTTASSSSWSATELAATRILGPVSRAVVTDTVTTVRRQCRDQDNDDTPRRVTDFGQLARAAMQTAVERLLKAAPSSSRTVSQIQASLRAELEFRLQPEFEQQVQLLSEDTFQAFRKELSKLIVGPNLAADMENVVREHMTSFAKQAKRLVAPGIASWSPRAAHAALQSRLRDTVTRRLSAARAAGKFRPSPRRGVTIGLHWLLPKPFGNDYRQEPWSVHASDNLVYVPPGKVTEVSPQTVADGGDWRSQIVPSPVGNDMVFMQ